MKKKDKKLFSVKCIEYNDVTLMPCVTLRKVKANDKEEAMKILTDLFATERYQGGPTTDIKEI